MPNLSNLRRRARSFGLSITRTTTAEDKAMFGEHRYALSFPGADVSNYHDVSAHAIELGVGKLEAGTLPVIVIEWLHNKD